MTTRQHLIEQDCMDKLHWNVERVALSSDDEMIQALAKFESLDTPASSPERILPTKPSEIHLVERLRDVITMKTVCIASNDLLDEDADFLRVSIDRDTQTLKSAMASLMDQVDCQRIQENKKCKIRTLLQTVVNSVGGTDDAIHLKEVDRQILVIKENIQEMRRIIGPGPTHL